MPRVDYGRPTGGVWLDRVVPNWFSGVIDRRVRFADGAVWRPQGDLGPPSRLPIDADSVH
jgi:hypothetical protein